MANSNTHVDYIGNTGFGNTFGTGNDNCGNITINQPAGRDSPPTDAEILQCLYTSRYESHMDRIREPAEGTCIWVTEHEKYKDWLGKTTSGVLWLSADPGCGKSVIAAFLAKHLKLQPDAIVCYFFFKDDSDEQKNAAFALCAILHQLFALRNTLCRYTHEVFKAKGKSFTEEVGTLWGILVKAVAEGGCGDVICVIDALDECEERTRAQLIRHLALLPRSHPNTSLKFLVTSRPYHEIAERLGTPTTTIRLKGEDELNSIATDVNRVINEGIKNLESYWGRPGGLGYLRDLLESSADRTFLWVALVLEILRESGGDSPGEFSHIVSTAPRNLPELYTKILDKSRNRDTAQRILHIVVGAKRPLSLREINVAFRIRQNHTTIADIGDYSSGSETTVKDLCGLFVRIIDSKVYLVHQTAREFLIKGPLPGKGNWQYTLCPVDSSFLLANICITYLSLEDFENDPLGFVTRGSDGAQVIGDYVQKYPLLDYAASHWAGHFQDLGKRQMELFESTRLICKHGSKRLLTWLRVYWGNSGQPDYLPFPYDFTHLMIASWFGQRSLVKRLLKEGSINARSELYGTALNVAAVRKEKDITEMLKGRVNLIIRKEEYNILFTSARELYRRNRYSYYLDQQDLQQDLLQQLDLDYSYRECKMIEVHLG